MLEEGDAVAGVDEKVVGLVELLGTLGVLEHAALALLLLALLLLRILLCENLTELLEAVVLLRLEAHQLFLQRSLLLVKLGDFLLNGDALALALLRVCLLCGRARTVEVLRLLEPLAEDEVGEGNGLALAHRQRRNRHRLACACGRRRVDTIDHGRWVCVCVCVW